VIDAETRSQCSRRIASPASSNAAAGVIMMRWRVTSSEDANDKVDIEGGFWFGNLVVAGDRGRGVRLRSIRT
jgi:hypothetical protein